MKDQVITLLEAIRLSRAELDAYLEQRCDADPEMTLARLVAILKHAEVTRATRTLSGYSNSPSIVPSACEDETVAELPGATLMR